MKKQLLFIAFLVWGFVGFGQCPNGLITLSSQAQVDAFAATYPGCTQLNNSLTINGDDITNLNGLSGITSIGGNLEISFNDNLLSFQGLENLESINAELFILFNPAIINFDGLNNLVSVNHFKIFRNDALIDFTGLDNLTTVGNLTSISENYNLASLDGLEGLQSAAYVIISYNTDLTSIEGIQNIEPVRFEIVGNFSLSQCAILPVCEEINISPQDVLIGNNAPGCNSVPEVEAQCELSVTENSIAQSLILFPNPVTSTLQIQISEGMVFEKATVYSILGKRLLETSENQINMETLSTGIYFVEVFTDKGSITRKIVKE